MKKLKMARGVTLTFEEGCNKYLENCRQRNLREGRQIAIPFFCFMNEGYIFQAIPYTYSSHKE